MEEKFSEKTLENFVKEKEEKAVEGTELSPEERLIVEKIYEEAKMPTVLHDDKIVCGEGELDIRNLTRKNRDQLFYRVEMLNLVYLRRLHDSLTDILRLLIVMLRNQGVENISEALSDAIESLTKEMQGELR